MAFDLPSALRAAIGRELDGADRRRLAEATAATSRAYRAGGTSAVAIAARDEALAYALVRLPATYAACARVFDELRARAPAFAPDSLLDAGSGPGGGSWAAADAWPGLARITWAETNASFLDLARRLAADGPPAVSGAAVERADLAAGPAPPAAELVLASYVLAEIPAAGQARVVARLWEACDGVLALVEPGTPAGYARILEARRSLIGLGATILAPCPHAGPCPLAPPDWCHFAVRVARSREHRRLKGADAPFEDEKFAYLLAARPGVAGEAAEGRVLDRPRTGKPGIDLKVCGPAGVEGRFVPRRDRAAHRQARRLDWGDAI